MQRRLSFLKKSSAAGALLLGAAMLLSPLVQATDYGYTFLRERDQQMRNGSAWWRPGAPGGTPSIKIDLSEQKAYFFKGGRLVGISPVSTGKAGHRTPTGSFRISEMKVTHRSNLYGHYVDRRGYVRRSNVDVRRHRRPPGTMFRGASMDYMMRINGPITMHAGRVPGYPDSHGCIRLPWHMAKIFFQHARVGTRVSVVH